MKISSDLTFSIPHTRRHVKFIEEVDQALTLLKIENINYVDEGDPDSQESWVRFYVDEEYTEFAQKLVQYLSLKARTNEELLAFKKEFVWEMNKNVVNIKENNE
jgi:hypothetical protein